MDVRRRVRTLERYSAREANRFAQLMGDDRRWADPEFRREIGEQDRRLREEAKTLEQMRQATRRLIGLMWEMAGDPERAKAVVRGHGNLDDESSAALVALDEDGVRRLQAALAYLSEATKATPTNP